MKPYGFRKVHSANIKFKEPEEPDSVKFRYGQIFETSTKKQKHGNQLEVSFISVA